MQYLGGKARARSWLIPILNQHTDPAGVFFEPFVGGLNVGPWVDCPSKICSDNNLDLILLYREYQTGWRPPAEVSEALYRELRHAPSSALRGFGGCFVPSAADSSRGTREVGLVETTRVPEPTPWPPRSHSPTPTRLCSGTGAMRRLLKRPRKSKAKATRSRSIATRPMPTPPNTKPGILTPICSLRVARNLQSRASRCSFQNTKPGPAFA